MKPLAIDLFCGLGGWAYGLLAEGWDVIGFDIEAHCYDGERYPAQLVLQDVATLHGSQFRTADLIVASPPCQAYSYRAMPWKRAKALPPPDNTLFEACFRIQREASDAAGYHIPLIVENVRGAQKWVGRSRWNFGSYHLWGDVPALMPMTFKGIKRPGMDWKPPDDPRHRCGQAFNTQPREDIKNNDGSWFAVANNTSSGLSRNPDGRHVKGLGGSWFGAYSPDQPGRNTSSGNTKRKYYAAQIAKIPFPLAQHIARVFKPEPPSALTHDPGPLVEPARAGSVAAGQDSLGVT